MEGGTGAVGSDAILGEGERGPYYRSKREL